MDGKEACSHTPVLHSDVFLIFRNEHLFFVSPEYFTSMQHSRFLESLVFIIRGKRRRGIKKAVGLHVTCTIEKVCVLSEEASCGETSKVPDAVCV